ncbi:MAG: VanZ family protein [Ruminococcus sp.]|nr:VanZ family protein [Ruminococcus sp.]
MRTPYPEIRYTVSVQFIGQIFLDHNPYALFEALLNFVMLFPVGLFMPLFFKRKKAVKTTLFGAAFTLFIEITQLITHLGEFQTDDVILNISGCAAGVCIYILISHFSKDIGKAHALK